jgi:formylmethanofuran dehydrogenase subunit A
MLIQIKGAHIVDPANRRDEVGDLWIRDDAIVASPQDGAKPDETVDAKGLVAMAGGIDIHSHIAGANVNTARLMLPEWRRAHARRPDAAPLSDVGWSTFETGRLYAEMGFTTVVEPAVAPHHALHAHLELADIPIIDKAILTILGNDDFVLGLMRSKESAGAVRDHVAWTLATTRALGIKVVNAGGVAAFKENVRSFSFDDVVPYYGVTSRQIVKALQKALHETGAPHPLHVHCNNLGLPGNFETALMTIAAAEDLPLHLAHLQFYGYGKEGPQGFSSAAPRLAEAVNAAKTVTIDVGQVMFGQTVTISSDVLRQFSARGQARPKKYAIVDGDSNGGGIVPYEYRAGSFHNAVQFAVGLELFLLIDDPWRVFLTTDHPNGAPFTTYPEILSLLMDKDLRADWLSRLPTEALAVTTLASLKREYSLSEIATMTRAAPAKLAGFPDRGHLGVGARADVALYRPSKDIAQMFRSAARVYKDGDLVVRDGAVTQIRFGRALEVTPTVEASMQRRMEEYYDARYGLKSDFMRVPDSAVGRPRPFETVACMR